MNIQEVHEMVDNAVLNLVLKYPTYAQFLVRIGYKYKNFGNARFVVKFVQKLLMNHAYNSSQESDASKLKTVQINDIPKVEEIMNYSESYN